MPRFLDKEAWFSLIFPIQTMTDKARSSGGERFPDTEEVGGSIPPVPTIKNNYEVKSRK